MAIDYEARLEAKEAWIEWWLKVNKDEYTHLTDTELETLAEDAYRGN